MLIVLLHRLFIVGLIIFISPLLGIISIAILLDSGFPILYKQLRVGKRGRKFTLFKFRTMVIDAEKLKSLNKRLNEADGPVFKIREDPRFTRLGKFLSHTGWDELPQLFNILKNEMALIGPRPLPISEARKLKSWQKKRQAIKPGIISPWVFEGYHQNPFNAGMASDIDYVRQKSLTTDCILFVKSIVFIGKLLIQELENRLFSHL